MIKKLRSVIGSTKIGLIAYDFDGVMTDNRIILTEDGVESVIVNRSDGLAVGMLKSCGILQIIISTEKNKVVAKRAQKLGIPVMQNVSNKCKALSLYCLRNNVLLKNVIYIGNDLNDLEVMRRVGYPVCPSNACKDIKAVAKIVLNTSGGYGVVRELFELINRNDCKKRIGIKRGR